MAKTSGKRESESAKMDAYARGRGAKRATVSRPDRGKVHSDIIAAYVAEGYQTSGLVPALQRAMIGHSCRDRCSCEQDPGESDPFCEWRDAGARMRAACKYIPDGFRINDELGLVEILEVDVTSHTSDAKLAAYGSLWWVLDGFDSWEVEVVVVDRFGIERRFNAGDIGYQKFDTGIEISPRETRPGPAHRGPLDRATKV